jgi:hypothetical protein
MRADVEWTYHASDKQYRGIRGYEHLLHQRRRHGRIFFVKPRQSELPEVDTAREGRQSTGERFHSSRQIKVEDPSQPG